VSFDSMKDIDERNGCHQCQLMVNYWKSVRAVENIQFNAATALPQASGVSFYGRFRRKLVPSQIGVVGGVDPVVRYRMGHVLIHHVVFGVPDLVFF